ncbi:hypothetical protein ACT4US_25300, partial [Bacillus sp. HC-Mk]
MNWQLNDGYEFKAFRNGEALLSPVIKTLKQMSEAMQKGDQKALEEAGISYDENLVIDGDYTYDSG